MMCSLIILLHQESFIMEENKKQIRIVGGRGGGKRDMMIKAMFDTKEKIAIVSHSGIRYSEWADAEEIK